MFLIVCSVSARNLNAVEIHWDQNIARTKMEDYILIVVATKAAVGENTAPNRSLGSLLRKFDRCNGERNRKANRGCRQLSYR